MAAEPILRTNALTIGYAASKERHVVARDLALELHAGELVCLLGPNGAGKSTLLRTLSALQRPLDGDVVVDGQALHSLTPLQLARLVSVVLTDKVSVGLLRVYDLVAVGRHPHTGWTGRLTATDRRAIRMSLEAVGAWGMAGRFVSELSDGERQRIMMARALAQDPRLMVLDEITAFLDLPHRIDAMRILRELAHVGGRAVLISTHDLDLALRTADRIWLLAPGGHMHVGAPEDLVLSGVFEAVFAADGIRFDRDRGAFELPRGVRERIQLVGDGVAARWTARALERLGFEVVETGTLGAFTITVSEDPQPRWQSSINGHQRVHASIADLTSALPGQRQTKPSRADAAPNTNDLQMLAVWGASKVENRAEWCSRLRRGGPEADRQWAGPKQCRRPCKGRLTPWPW